MVFNDPENQISNVSEIYIKCQNTNHQPQHNLLTRECFVWVKPEASGADQPVVHKGLGIRAIKLLLGSRDSD